MPPLRRSRREIDYSQFCDVLDDCSGSDDDYRLDYEQSPSPPPVKRFQSNKKKSSPKNKNNIGKQKRKVTPEAISQRSALQEKQGSPPKVMISTVKIYEYQDRVYSNNSNSSHQTKLSNEEIKCQSLQEST